MNTAPQVGATITALSAALDRQRQALIADDVASLQASSDEVLRLLEAIRAAGPIGSARDKAALEKAQIALRANAQLLAKSASANARALAVLFDTSATYGPDGASPIASPSRRISAA